jgi:hypothetical protein
VSTCGGPVALTPAVLVTPLRSVPQRGPLCSRKILSVLMEMDSPLPVAYATRSGAPLLLPVDQLSGLNLYPSIDLTLNSGLSVHCPLFIVLCSLCIVHCLSFILIASLILLSYCPLSGYPLTLTSLTLIRSLVHYIYLTFIHSARSPCAARHTALPLSLTCTGEPSRIHSTGQLDSTVAIPPHSPTATRASSSIRLSDPTNRAGRRQV